MTRGTGRTKRGIRARRWLVRIALVAGLLFVATIPGERRAASSTGTCGPAADRAALVANGPGAVVAGRVADQQEAAP